MSTSREVLAKSTVADLFKIIEKEEIPNYLGNHSSKGSYIDLIIAWRTNPAERNNIIKADRENRINKAVRNINKHIKSGSVEDIELAIESHKISINKILPLIIETGNVEVIKMISNHNECKDSLATIISMMLKDHKINTECIRVALNSKYINMITVEKLKDFIKISTDNNIWELFNKWPQYLLHFMSGRNSSFIDGLISKRLIEKYGFYSYNNIIAIHANSKSTTLIRYIYKKMWYMKRFLMKFTQCKDVISHIVAHIPMIKIDNLLDSDWYLESQVSNSTIDVSHLSDKYEFDHLSNLVAAIRNKNGDTRDLYLLLKKINRFYKDNPEYKYRDISSDLLLQMSPWLE